MRFDLDDEYLAVLKEELIDAQRLASDENGRIWYGLAMSKRNQHQPYHLLKQHSGLIPKKPKLPRLNLRLLNQSPLTLNVASSL